MFNEEQMLLYYIAWAHSKALPVFKLVVLYWKHL